MYPSTGTERYLAPELLEEDAIPTKASDVWALGCIGLEVSLLMNSATSSYLLAQFVYSTMPYQHINIKDGRLAMFNLFNEIKAAVPPAARPSHMDKEAATIWEILERCWRRPASARIHAKNILILLESKQMTTLWEDSAVLFREGTNVEGPTFEQRLNSIGSLENHERSYVLDSDDASSISEASDIGFESQNFSLEIQESWTRIRAHRDYPSVEISDKDLSAYSVTNGDSNGKFICFKCRQVFERKDRFKYHVQAHLGLTPYCDPDEPWVLVFGFIR